VIIENQATGKCNPAFLCLSQARINWEGCSRKGIRRKSGGFDGGGLLIGPDGVTPTRIVRVSVLSDTLLSSLAPLSPEKAFFWHRITWVIPEKGP